MIEGKTPEITIKQARQLLLAAVVSSRKHFDKEERIVFPLAERVLNAKTLAALGQTWRVRSDPNRLRTHRIVKELAEGAGFEPAVV